jgi:hypothetical protein
VYAHPVIVFTPVTRQRATGLGRNDPVPPTGEHRLRQDDRASASRPLRSRNHGLSTEDMTNDNDEAHS